MSTTPPQSETTTPTQNIDKKPDDNAEDKAATATDKKPAANAANTASNTFKVFLFLCLTAIMVFVGVIYKVSQTGSKYDYSPASAIVLAEIIKLLMSIGMDLYQTRSLTDTKNAFISCFKSHGIPIGILATMYAINNQLTFFLYIWSDPATVTLFKSCSSFLTSFILCMVFNRTINTLQWKAIILQVFGLLITQLNPCTQMAALAFGTYIGIFAATMLTTVSGVVNEYQVKSAPYSINIVNTVLYVFGVVENSLLYAFFDAPGIKKVSWFFEGYTPSVFLVVLANSVIGIAITLVYKYTDAIVKTFATACATCALIFISSWFFGLDALFTAYLGCIVVFVSSHIFMVDAKQENLPPLELRCKNPNCCSSLPV